MWGEAHMDGTHDSGTGHDQYAEDRRWMAALLDETHIDHNRRWREAETYIHNVVAHWCFAAGAGRASAKVEDLQSACMEAISKSLGSFRHDSALTTWMHSVILLRLKKYLRDTGRQKRDPRRTIRLEESHLAHATAPDNEDPASLVIGNELLLRIEAELRAHTNKHIYTVFMLIAIQRRRGTEVAAMLDISQPHVSNLLREARSLLRRSPALRPWLDDYLASERDEAME